MRAFGNACIRECTHSRIPGFTSGGIIAREKRKVKRHSFLDPPFESGLLEQVATRLQGGWLAPGAWIYVECLADSSLATLPVEWRVQRTRRAGQVGYHLLRASDPANEVSP